MPAPGVAPGSERPHPRRPGTRRRLGAAARTWVLLAAIVPIGCREFEMRQDPDLFTIRPAEARRLEKVRIDPHYAARLSDRAAWRLYTSLGNATALSDGDPGTVALSSDEHRRGEWILIDLGCVCHFQSVSQHHPAGSGVPPRYRVDTAGDHGFPFTLQYVGAGQPGASIATFPTAVDARLVRLTIIEDAAEPWAVAEIELY